MRLCSAIRCLSEWILAKIPAPTLDGVPEIVVKAVQRITKTLPADFKNASIWGPVCDRYPDPFKIFPQHELVAKALLTDNDVVVEMSRHLIGSVMSLLGVGIRFKVSDFLTTFNVPAEDLGRIFPLLALNALSATDILEIFGILLI